MDMIKNANLEVLEAAFCPSKSIKVFCKAKYILCTHRLDNNIDDILHQYELGQEVIIYK